MAGSSRPPPHSSSPSAGLRRLRPWYLVATMIITLIVGVHGMATGCTMVSYLREGNMPDVSEIAADAKEGQDPVQYVIVVVSQAARLRAMAEAREVTFPLNAAKMLLAGFLLVASALAMFGRPGARNLALQALFANAVLAAIDYALTRSVRSVWIDEVVREASALPKIAPEQAYIVTQAFWWWFERFQFVFVDVGLFALAALALTRRKTKTFFEAVAAAAASERSDEP